jgi:hypothetical protein
MKRLDAGELAAWCATSGYSLENWSPALVKAASSVTLLLPSEVQQIPELIDDLVAMEQQARKVVWIRDWTIWSDRSQDIGLRHLELITQSSEDLARGVPLGGRYLLEREEWRDAIALLTLSVLYGWDVFLMFESGIALVGLTHEGVIHISLDRAPTRSLESWM